MKYFAKHAAELLKRGYKPLKFDVKEINVSSPPLHIESKFEVTKEIILELNKIAIEFYAFSGLELQNVKHISERVNILDTALNNVIFCNWEGEVRTMRQQEISHLIVLRTNVSGTLYCYIELFNIICAYIKLYDNCDKQIDIVYHQDAITGERFTEDIQLNLETEPVNKNDTESFEILINAMLNDCEKEISLRSHQRFIPTLKTRQRKKFKPGLWQKKILQKLTSRDVAKHWLNYLSMTFLT